MHYYAQKRLKTLALLLVVVFAMVVYERTETLFSQTSPTEQVAAIWNPISAFLGIQQSGDPGYTDPNDPFSNTQDDYGFGNVDDDLGFSDIPNDPFGGTPVPTNTESQDGFGSTFVNTSGGDQATFAPTTNSSQTIDNLSPTFVCLPDVISQGEEAIIMYACRDSSETASAEFIQDNAPIGTSRVTPSDSTSYSINCSEGTTSTCDITVAKPALAIIATPRSSPRGGTVSLSWRTKDTQSCVVTSNDPNHRGFERSGTEGEAISPTLFGNTTFFLTCETIAGIIEERSVTVGVN